MSAEATGWVYRHSPYRGIPFAIHLAIADSVNDQNADEFWMRQSVLATKARTSRGSVNAAITTMVDDGLLLLIRAGKGGANRYRLLMPADQPQAYNPRAWMDDDERGVSRERTPQGVGSDDTGCQPSAQGVSSHVTGGARPADTEPKGNPTNPTGTQPPLELVGGALAQPVFRVFWDVYPRHVAKAAAEKAWAAALKLATADVIVAGATRYAAEVADRTADKIAHPATWLNGRRWEDPPGANASQRGGPGGRPTRGATAPVTADRNGREGRVAM